MSRNPTAAVLMFPGTNCELETARALTRNGFDTQILRWNEASKLSKYAAVVLAGGFSYEDRGRSGLIASHDPVLRELARFVQAGKPVLGICNGAQILIESGLVPAGRLGASPLALTRNRRVDTAGRVLGTGFYNAWVSIRSGTAVPNAFNQFDSDTILQIPVAHAEGRFYSLDGSLLEQLVEHGQNAFVYCTESGELDPHYPTNPNGSVLSLAGVVNPAGNCLALMPHPERTVVGDPIFRSMRKWITGHKAPSLRSLASDSELRRASLRSQSTRHSLKVEQRVQKILAKPKFDVEFFISLQITDNEALSVQQAAREAGSSIELQKYRWLGLATYNAKRITYKDLEKIIRAGDLANAEKETVILKFKGEFYQFDKAKGFVKTKFALPKLKVLVAERETSLDDSLAVAFNHTLGSQKIAGLKSGVLWAATAGSPTSFDRVVRAGFFHHAAAADLIKI